MMIILELKSAPGFYLASYNDEGRTYLCRKSLSGVQVTEMNTIHGTGDLYVAPVEHGAYTQFIVPKDECVQMHTGYRHMFKHAINPGDLFSEKPIEEIIARLPDWFQVSAHNMPSAQIQNIKGDSLKGEVIFCFSLDTPNICFKQYLLFSDEDDARQAEEDLVQWKLSQP